MSVMDWIFAGVVALLAVRCFVRGFVAEVLSVAAYAVGLVIALLFYNSGSVLLAEKAGLASLSPTIRYIISFIACFIAGFLVMKLIEKLVRGGLEAANLEMLDRILGLALGVVEGLAVVALVLVIMDLQTLFDAGPLLAESAFARSILPLVGPTIDQTLRPAVQSFGTGTIVPDLLKKK
ncbi:MAG: CvpA family protein [Rectinema sp.]